ncbi:MAG: hypothetical protein L0214_13085 [candidate division NC10 bacterium]|nr:hypothetical protein [candidate division NC10 bacterium]
MCSKSVITLLVGMTGIAGAQEAPVRVYPGERLVSLTAGVGNAMGWFGAQGERYLLDERLSIFVGLGYTPQIDPGDPTGPTFAAGLRSFTSGLRHRFFMEASASQLIVEPVGADGGRRLYGPGLQGGYQFVPAGGFTLMASVGAGYALGVPRGGDPWATQVGLGLGYTWRRPARVSGPLDRRRM